MAATGKAGNAWALQEENRIRAPCIAHVAQWRTNNAQILRKAA
jgi:hypothetical protein